MDGLIRRPLMAPSASRPSRQGAVVRAAWLTGLTACELDGRTRAQVLATLTVAMSAVGLLAGHLLATATLVFAVWVAITLGGSAHRPSS